VSEPKRVDYDGRLHAVYRFGRAMQASVMRMWMEMFAEYVSARRHRVTWPGRAVIR
jgi:hypothetical protein